MFFLIAEQKDIQCKMITHVLNVVRIKLSTALGVNFRLDVVETLLKKKIPVILCNIIFLMGILIS